MRYNGVKLNLPRKRKKQCKKEMGDVNYLGILILNEILQDENPKNKPSFKKYAKDGRLLKTF